MNQTLYASVLHLDRNAVKHLKITDPYSLHRVVYSLFTDVRSDEDKKQGQSSGILYADQGGDFKERHVLLLSARLPVSRVEGRYGRVETREIPGDFLNGDLYRFKTVVNPCYRENASRKLVPVKGRQQIASWFRDRAMTSWGFEVSRKTLQVDTIEVLRFTGKNSQRITLARATLQGVLQVRDRALFINSFCRGIGRGKAFGCGLLQIVPQTFSPFA
ncbi:type I-E CRISPR-associated protein Cas6/Cse3/CasE [Thermodesulfobacteriota bacterium B35]